MNADVREEGAAVLVAMMAVLLMTAIGTALIVSSTSETVMAANFQEAVNGRYAAGVMLERGLDDLLAIGDWSAATTGLVQSPWVDGPPTGTRTIAGGSTIDLMEVLNLARCQKSAACSDADIVEATPDRPWGEKNPDWKLYAYGRLPDLLTGVTVDSQFYVILLVGSGPADNLLALRAEAYGPRGAHAVVEATAGRTSAADKGYNDEPVQDSVKVLSWREVR
jgi:hypothetical protein